MVMWYWSVAILFWQLSIDHIVNVQYKRCGFAKTRLRHPSLPFDSLPYPTRPICRRVRSVNQVTSKRKEVYHILWVWGCVPHALRARRSPAIMLINCERQKEPATYSWSAALSLLYSKVFPDSVHILGMPVLYRLICVVCGREGPGVEFMVCLTSR